MENNIEPLAKEIEKLYEAPVSSAQAKKIFSRFLALLNSGEIRAAEQINGTWQVHQWVKKGILLGFRLGVIKEIHSASPFPFFDKETFPLKNISRRDGVRIVPGGTSIRSGSFIAPGVVIMPPAYINVGAYIGKNTLVDSHVLVGSCAQIGERVHLSAGVQIGGVLEPAGALPVIVEDDVLIGGNCGVYEGTIIRKRAVIGSGVIFTASTPMYDCVNDTIIKKDSRGVLVVPENAVVVAGTRKINTAFGSRYGLGMYTPLIIKYRDAKTDARTALEELLR
ncbi:MAG: 2,3,4,5-tetrahydropyridine-2,6-dicarboxylate N-succinyltransferase [Bacteroidetes bacterium]|nr:2,3,4,5-tetrahydropyridine-2,6-dicarboxylate N-succinyltransferase [Bacteroidota bacterium]